MKQVSGTILMEPVSDQRMMVRQLFVTVDFICGYRTVLPAYR